MRMWMWKADDAIAVSGTSKGQYYLSQVDADWLSAE